MGAQCFLAVLSSRMMCPLFICFLYVAPPFAPISFRGSIVVSILACHAGDPGSIPGLGVLIDLELLST